MSGSVARIRSQSRVEDDREFDTQFSNSDRQLRTTTTTDLQSRQDVVDRQRVSHGHSPMSFQVFIAKYSYDPEQYSPNDNPDVELALTAGDYLFVYGDMDEDGFYEGELMTGKRGLVPSNFIEKVPDEELEDFHGLPLSMRNGHSIDGANAGSDLNDAECCDERFKRKRSNVVITEHNETYDVPAPRNLVLERQLSTSFIVAWSPPANLSPDEILAYNIYSNGLFVTTVRSDDRTKALLEKLDPSKKHQVSVRTVTKLGHSCDYLCTIVLGGESSLSPSSLKVTEIAAKSAVVSWVPASSNLEHAVSVDGEAPTIISRTCFVCYISGLTPDCEHSVTVCAVEPNTHDVPLDLDNDSISTSFFTLREVPLPDAPMGVQVEAGPQRGTLLVMWTPVADKKPVDEETAALMRAITGYTVYVDGTLVKQLDSPSGDHVMLDSCNFASFPADPKQVTVRTAACDLESRDSRPAELTHQLLEEIRTGMMLTECEQARKTSPDLDAMLQSPTADQTEFNGRTATDRRSKQNGSHGHARAVPHIEITLDSLSGSSSGSDNINRRARARVTVNATESTTSRRPRATSDATAKDGSTAVDVQRGASRADDDRRRGWHVAGRRRDDGHGGGEDQGASDADTVEDSLLGDSDENGRGRQRPSRGHRHGHQRSGRGHRPRHPANTSSYRIFIALFDYNPATMSPNRNAVDEELAFYEGQLLKIYGPKDADGFYLGETEGRRGLVPYNMVSEVHVDSPEIADRLLRENTTPPPPHPGRGASRPPVGARPGHPPRHHRPAGYDERHRPAGSGHSPMRPRVAPRSMVAIYDYNPHELSPNVDVEKELQFKMGDVITVYGDVDYDGFYRGELAGRRGLVPSNFLRPADASPCPPHPRGPTSPLPPPPTTTMADDSSIGRGPGLPEAPYGQPPAVCPLSTGTSTQHRRHGPGDVPQSTGLPLAQPIESRDLAMTSPSAYVGGGVAKGEKVGVSVCSDDLPTAYRPMLRQ